MKIKKKTRPPRLWYERIFDRVELVNTKPELAPYLDVDQLPKYQANVLAKLVGQGLPLTPPRTLKTLTPKKLGQLLGQQCATLHALGEQLQSLDDPEKIKQAAATAEALTQQSQMPGVSNVLHAAQITGMMLEQLLQHIPQFEKTVQAAVKAALDQPNYQEAVEFFRGFAQGMTKPGLKDGKLVGQTDATMLQLKMFMLPEAAAKKKNVAEWRAFLLENGETEATLGDEERLQKFCQRIGYAPGKRGRPPKPK